MAKLGLVLLLIAATSMAWPWNEKCRALAFAGSGDKGPYQIGAFQGLLESLGPDEVKYDIVTGISVGAINALLFSQYAVGDEAKFLNETLGLWQ